MFEESSTQQPHYLAVARFALARFAMYQAAATIEHPFNPQFASKAATWAAGELTPQEYRLRALALEQPISEGIARLRSLRPIACIEMQLMLSDYELLTLALLFAADADMHIAQTIATFCDKPVGVLTITSLIRIVAAFDENAVHETTIALSNSAPLLLHGLVVVEPEGGFGARRIGISKRCYFHLLGIDALDSDVEDWTEIFKGDEVTAIAPCDVLESIAQVLARPSSRLRMYGAAGIGKSWIACNQLATHSRVLRVPAELLLLAEDLHAIRLQRLLRECLLSPHTALCLDASNVSEVEPSVARLVERILRRTKATVVVTANERLTWHEVAFPGYIEIDLPSPTYAERVRLWRSALDYQGITADVSTLELCAGRYSLAGGTIHSAARRLREQLSGHETHATRSQVSDAARHYLGKRLGHGAKLVASHFSWDDLVLPPEQSAGVREIIEFANLRPTLFETWGFSAKLPYGRGISALFAGPPGTGKTMVAQVLARELGYDLYRIDVSQLVNKYIGETEKNLARIFDEAERSQAILFFDEADSLFAKRTEVKSSNDRYANLEVNFLLQRMETYDGIALLATNIEQGLDDAFRRRIRFVVNFEMPDVRERLRLWRSMFPVQAPVAPDINWQYLAEHFEFTGSYIKRVVLRAALAAASRTLNRIISFDDLHTAARQEYSEMGRVMTSL